MGRSLNQVMADLPGARRAKIKARVAEIIAEEMSLHDIRKAMSKTQVSLAKQLGVGQDSISRLERRADMLLSTLNTHIQAIGGKLHIVAELPNRPPVRITKFGAIVTHEAGKKASVAAHRATKRSSKAALSPRSSPRPAVD
jgi:hypothetical protein